MEGTVVLGKYRVGRFIGKGSMGLVHLARPLAGGDEVVVKFMNARSAAEPRFREQFGRELALMARFRHPHAVQLLEGSLDDAAGPCIVMEYVKGLDLAAVLAVCKRFEADRLARLAIPLCQALHAAHASNIIHRDLKPANLKIRDPGLASESITVMDLGLASLNDKPYIPMEKLRGTTDSYAVGTPAYMSPEQIRGDGVDARSDIYSLGVVLYEALAGRLPFEDQNVDSLLKAHIGRQPPRFAEVGAPDVPTQVEALIRQCIEKFPNERPQSPFDVAKRMVDALGWSVELDRAAFLPSGGDSVLDAPSGSQPPSGSSSDRIVQNLEAWMPEPIAVVKLRGYFEDQGARILSSEPGLIKVQLGEIAKAEPPTGVFKWFRKPPPPPPPDQAPLEPVAIDLYMTKKMAGANRLEVTAVFRGLDGALPADTRWHKRTKKLFTDLRSYLMAQR